MGVTQLSFLLFPLCFYCILSPERQLMLVFVFGTMPAAAALVFGGFGVQPSLIPALLFIAYVLLQMLLGVTYRGSDYVMKYFAPFMAVTGYAVAGSVILPRLFEGKIFVYPQKQDAIGGMMLLQPTASNLTQDSYILINTLFLVVAACYLTRPGLHLRRIFQVYWASGFLVAAVCFWQLANKLAHVPFPEEFFFSNPGWSLLTTQSFGRVPRINGSFPEPAAAATYLAGIIYSTAWTILKGHRSRMARLLLPTALLAILITTSTTGYAALAIGGAMLSIHSLLTGATRILARIALVGSAAVGMSLFVVLAVATFSPATIGAANTVLASTLSKGDSASYNDRTNTDEDSLEMVVPTYGLGTGWGSNRASSLIPSLLSTIGVVGVLGLIWFNLSIVRKLALARRSRPDDDQRMLLDATSMALVGRIVAICLSGPNVTFTDFYLITALQAATVANVVLARGRQPDRAAKRVGRLPLVSGS